MDLGLTGKTALVTAASKGMGKACAIALAAEGARVVMCARTEADLQAAAAEIRGKGAEVVAMPADVTRAADVTALVARAEEAFGGVDVLVANAGGPPRGYFDEL
jgi:3-oxoacyl-[acyl-carrier protein] reductase